jgi:hypothetical protein
MVLLVLFSAGSAKTRIAYFKPMPIVKPLKLEKWGYAADSKCKEWGRAVW